MSMEQKYNLDDKVHESFRFTIRGHEYEFRQLTTEEIDSFQTMKTDKEIREYLYRFITPINKESPDFKDMTKKMLAPHWKNFLTMVKTEMQVEG